MRKLRCLIVDDKPLAIDLLADYVQKVSFLELASTTTNPLEGLTLVREQNIDLVFLDIQMPELNGIQFIKIAGKHCNVILTTAYSKYALDGYEHDVVDYLMKPISFERFYRAAEKARQLMGAAESKNNATETLPNEPSTAYLFIKTEHRIQRVNLSEVLYIEALQNYIAVNTAGQKVLSLITMKKIEEQLPKKDFVRVHKSFIVGLRHISSVERSRIFIGDTIIPVGDNYRDNFYDLIGLK
jgi:two-component system LytT family response regulator